MPAVGKTSKALAPFWSGRGVDLYHGNVIEVLRKLPSRSVHCCVTSPPYWALRSYLDAEHQDKHHEIGAEDLPDCLGWARGENCAERDWSEACHVCRIVLVFREVRRILRHDGVLWLNYGDTYSSAGSWAKGVDYGTKSSTNVGSINRKGRTTPGLAAGNLVMVPARVVLALQADGWILRSDIPWVKCNSMPESALNRPGKAVENVFMLVKDMNYYFDMEAVRKEGKDWSVGGPGVGITPTTHYGQNNGGNKGLIEIAQRYKNGEQRPGRNFRNADLWFESVNGSHGMVGVGDEIVGLDVPVGSFKGAHFATFSPRLITPLILAGTSEFGCCAKCGKPWSRILSKVASGLTEGEYAPPGQAPHSNARDRSLERNRNGITGSLDGEPARTSTVGWAPTCQCHADVVPCTVLDPFCGSGTTCAVAVEHGRRSIGIDLNDKYLTEFAIPRIEAVVMKERGEMSGAPAGMIPPAPSAPMARRI